MSSYAITREGRMVKIAATLLSDSSGDATVTAVLEAPIRVNHTEIIIDISGATEPSTGYDVYVKNADGVDILGGGGVNLGVTAQLALQCKVDATPVVIQGGYMLVASGDLVFTGDDMGAANVAVVNVYGELVR